MEQVESNLCWLNGLIYAGRFYGLAVSEEKVYADARWATSEDLPTFIERTGRNIGLSVVPCEYAPLQEERYPVLVELQGGGVAFVEEADNLLVSTEFTESATAQKRYTKEEFSLQVTGLAVVVRPAVNQPDPRIDEYIKPYEENWFRRIVLRDYKKYGDVIIASLVANILALSSMIFSMQMYDRVIPSQSENTLWVLFTGVMIALIFEFLLRTSRVVITDHIGKKADLRLSDYVFGRALRIKTTEKPKSTGTFIAQLRELEQVREMITSNVMASLADLPFIFLFLFVLWFIGGKLVFLVLAVIPLAIIPSLLAQYKFAKLAKEGMRESTLRNSLLVEVVQGSEDIKLMRAEARFEHQWRNYNEFLAEVGLKQRFLTALLLNGFAELQSFIYVCVLLTGSYLVMSGELTTGALIGCSILASRTIASIIRATQVVSRWQQTKISYESLDNLMRKPVDYAQDKQTINVESLQGKYELNDVMFTYGDENAPPVLRINKLQIAQGEKIAILGRIGAGKSTLLQLLAGLAEPQAGLVKIDDLNLNQVDTSTVRRDIGLLQQNARLFFGTVRDNLLLGKPEANDTQILVALRAAGALSVVQKLPNGLDYLIMEGGMGLSGGQRQALLLARLLLKEPNILLFDEPTSALDPNTEQAVLTSLATISQAKTLVVATHKMSVLRIVERIIVLEGGRVVLDGPKDKVLEQLSGGAKKQ
ncbi:MAG TPA: type I secretion system permease/ATPase [Candidatus Avacidaminococcus intestinavium]|uniref:Type I secretion system permease/ATPase n=1 Tax=Candidatus Avacidaminococcus intestinavium TaxID=2840684 RepID=A0A9D1MPY8_9FIRM|nr:type I secretion system permease/ATPase [Candidatus Avacidaminococcus intestinavium]